MSSVVCIICHENPDGVEWSVLPCGHVFHGQCVSSWLRGNPCCPLCKRRSNLAPMKIYFETVAARNTMEVEQLTSRLKSRITDGSQKIMRLTTELESHQAMLDDRQEELMQTEREKMSLKQKLKDSDEELRQIQREKMSLMQKLKDSEKELKQTQREKMSLKHQLEDAEKELKQTQREKMSLMQKLKDSEKELKQTQREKMSLMQKPKDSEEELKQTQREKMSLKHQLKDAEKELRQTKREKMSLIHQLRDSDQRMAQLLDNQDEIQKENDMLYDRIAALNRQLRSVDQQNRDLRCNIDTMKSQQASRVSQLEAELSDCKQQLDLEQKKLSQINQQPAGLENRQMKEQNAVLGRRKRQKPYTVRPSAFISVSRLNETGAELETSLTAINPDLQSRNGKPLKDSRQVEHPMCRQNSRISGADKQPVLPNTTSKSYAPRFKLPSLERTVTYPLIHDSDPVRNPQTQNPRTNPREAAPPCRAPRFLSDPSSSSSAYSEEF